MIDHVIALLELLSAIAMVIALLALAGIALVSLLGAVGTVGERAGDRWQQAIDRITAGGQIVAGWLRNGVTILDVLAAALTGQHPQYYVERRAQRTANSRQTGLSANQTQTDGPSARHNDAGEMRASHTDTSAARNASMPARNASHDTQLSPVSACTPSAFPAQPARTASLDAAQRAVEDAQIMRLLRQYRTADALVEALVQAGWSVTQIRMAVRIDNNRVSEIVAKYRKQEAQDE